MRGFADATTESSTTGCLLGTGVTETEYDTADFVSDTTCFDKETTSGNLVLSTNVYFYDADGNRAWSGVSSLNSNWLKFYSFFIIKVQASCSIAEAVTVTPLTLTVTESTYTDVNTDETATELALQVIKICLKHKFTIIFFCRHLVKTSQPLEHHSQLAKMFSFLLRKITQVSSISHLATVCTTVIQLILHLHSWSMITNQTRVLWPILIHLIPTTLVLQFKSTMMAQIRLLLVVQQHSHSLLEQFITFSFISFVSLINQFILLTFIAYNKVIENFKNHLNLFIRSVRLTQYKSSIIEP